MRWGSDGLHRALVKDGLAAAAFTHYESRSASPCCTSTRWCRSKCGARTASGAM
ncbi:hypothetical protein ACO0M4_27120 [Streptomyces sp. RGM 3693]|uniref:hypothetical protein n=1 Tax=Streptomyces sp. RGM 3693 TaxID=3413284 RepID=UPI003D27BDD6